MKQAKQVRDFDFYIDEYMYNCQSRKLRKKTLQTYEQTLRLFERWCLDEMGNYPEFIFCDEPISALDVSVQAQVVNMLKDLQQEMGLTYLFTAHDLSMVHHISDRIGVMYLGSMVELGTSEEVFENPLHPYTNALISAIPIADPELGRKSQRIPIQGELPSPMNAPKGCRFCTRCPYATDRCREERPEFREITEGHFARCHIL